MTAQRRANSGDHIRTISRLGIQQAVKSKGFPGFSIQQVTDNGGGTDIKRKCIACISGVQCNICLHSLQSIPLRQRYNHILPDIGLTGT